MATNNNLNSATVPLTPAFGGTGVANTGTITVGGNTSFVGAHTFAGTITGDTAVTFPTSGTLATTTSASGTVNSGTTNQLAYYASSTNAVSGLSTTARSVLTTDSAGANAWIALTDGQIVVGSSAGSPAAASLSAGTGISITPGSNSISIAATGAAGITWANISGTTQAAAVNTGFVVGNASQTTITLPATAALGSTVTIQGKGAGGWILAANTGQTIQVGQTASTTAGSVTSAAAFDSIQVVCITANTTWATISVLSSGVTVA
jgi:hypothetical protein